MKRILTIALLAIALVAQAQHRETRKIAAPTAISVATSIETRYVLSNRNEVVVEVEYPDHLKKLETVVEDGELKIRYKPLSNIRTKKSNKVTVYSSGELTDIEVSSSGSLRIEDAFRVSALDIEVSSSGKLFAQDIVAEKTNVEVSSSGRFDGRIKTGRLDLDCSSSGQINLLGSAETAELEITSSGAANLGQMPIASASIEVGSSGSATVNVSGKLTGSVSSSGKIVHIGTPKTISVDRSSGGQVVKK